MQQLSLDRKEKSKEYKSDVKKLTKACYVVEELFRKNETLSYHVKLKPIKIIYRFINFKTLFGVS